jgi:hypothetical protein
MVTCLRLCFSTHLTNAPCSTDDFVPELHPLRALIIEFVISSAFFAGVAMDSCVAVIELMFKLMEVPRWTTSLIVDIEVVENFCWREGFPPELACNFEGLVMTSET